MSTRNRLLVVLTAMLGLLALTIGDAFANCPHNPPFKPYKVAECYQINKPDFTVTDHVTDAEWQAGQTWKSESKTDFSLDLASLCPAPPKCSKVKYQADLDLIASKQDEATLADNKANGLSRKPGEHHAQDSSIVQSWNVGILETKGCTPPPPPPPPPPHVHKKHAHAGANVKDECNCFRDKVTFSWNHHKVKGFVTHPNRTTWVAHLTGKKVGNKQFLLPAHLNGNSGWRVHVKYPVHTTNKPCPCHKTHTCPHNGPPHHHCPTVAGKLNDAKPCS